MTSRIVVLTAGLLATAMSVGAREIVEIRLLGRYYAEPATVEIVIAVEPDQANRTLRIEADGDRMYRSSEVALEGQTDKRLHTVEFKNLPAGDYELRAEVLSTSGVRGMATQELIVAGR
jgi:hypothetical protein